MGSRPSRSTSPIREREFHRWLARHLPAGRVGLLPLGDDAAAVRPPRGRVAVLTTDSLVEGTHFLRGSPPHRIGAAAVGVSLSDLAAKGARPVAVLLALILPRGTPSSWARALVDGAESLAEEFGASVLGGDTKPGPVRAVVSTALGWGDPRRLAARTEARAGDRLVTTGVVGRGGLAAVRLGGRRRPRVEALSALLDVRPRVREGLALAGWVHAMLDTSDGLAESSHLLADASRLRVIVEEPRLPLAPGILRHARTPSRRRTVAFFGGDYELLATLDPRVVERARRAVRSAGGILTEVGRIEPGRGAWLESPAGIVPMPRAAWRPFETDGRALL